MKQGYIYIGTSGWVYKHWKQAFYPDKLKAKDQLPFYATHFPTAEINASFYRLPLASTVQTWADAVQKDFRFCPKISRFVTHAKKLNDPDTTLPRFFEVFDHIVKKLGPVLIQLPQNLHYHAAKAQAFFEALKQYKGYTFALEPRHESWLQEDAVKMLKKYKIAFVIAHSGDRFPYAEIITSKHIYLRFHGPEGNYATSYTNAFLKKYAAKILAWQQAGHTIWVFFNNDGHAYAVNNAQTLLTQIKNATT